jgi:DNA invertase Pin-like site-specific DNA recombinase
MRLVGRRSRSNHSRAGRDDSVTVFSTQSEELKMMRLEDKVTAQHLQRAAYLYVRQSTLRQVLENTESTHRQYALKNKALELGWSEGQIVVIDCDLGQSGASTVDRAGFQRLVSEVGLGRAGIVMGLEVSRLARNSADWHRLLEICALTQTLILDEDGLYEPGDFNDRLLLGLKGTMSEAELHFIRARMRGGVLNKAKRGELRLPLPVGFVYDDDQHVVLDPDRQVQQAVRYFFETFKRTGAATATVRQFRREGVLFPRHQRGGQGELSWQPLTHGTALALLHNARYAGAFYYGSTKGWKDAQGKVRRKTLPIEQWPYLIKDSHRGYLRWEDFLENQERLRNNAQAYNLHPGGNPAREGPALLQGIVLCGRCGDMMGVHYVRQKGGEVPVYICQRTHFNRAEKTCQTIPGRTVDQAVGLLVVESVTPKALELALAVQSELEVRLTEADQLRRQQVERAQYEADHARLRYMRVDPNNRLVADNLETLWNEKLTILATAQEEYERGRLSDRQKLTDDQRQQILKLAEDFPRLWHDPKTSHRDRKRMVRLLVEDVTLKRSESGVGVHLRFKGGAIKELHLPSPLPAWEARKTKAEIVQKVNDLLDSYDEGQVAEKLNEERLGSSCGHSFTRARIFRLCQTHKLLGRTKRLQQRGYLRGNEMAKLLGVHWGALPYWRKLGFIKGTAQNLHVGYFYEPPSQQVIETIQNRSKRRSSGQQPLVAV